MMKQFLFVFTAILLDVMGCGPRNNVPNAFLNVSPKYVIFNNEQFASVKITITSSSPWTAMVSGEYFIELSPLAGKDNGTITVTALTKNESSFERTTKVIITNNEGEYQEVMVYQVGKTTDDK